MNERSFIIIIRTADGGKRTPVHVNFSREFQVRHWGGTAREAMPLYSVVNSLAKVEGVAKVQFLLEGEKQKSLLAMPTPASRRRQIGKRSGLHRQA